MRYLASVNPPSVEGRAKTTLRVVHDVVLEEPGRDHGPVDIGPVVEELLLGEVRSAPEEDHETINGFGDGAGHDFRDSCRSGPSCHD